MLCLQIAAEASWTCCTYLGWRKNRADKKAAAYVSACGGFHALATALALVMNRQVWGRFGSSEQGQLSWTSAFVWLFLFPSPCTAEIITPQSCSGGKVVMEKQCQGTGGGIQLLDSRAELTGQLLQHLQTHKHFYRDLDAPSHPALEKKLLILPFSFSHICCKCFRINHCCCCSESI